MYAIIEDSTSNKADMTRAASLIADMQGYKREAAPNKEMEQAIAQRMSSEDKELARVTSMIRTNEEARKGLRIA
jgi:isochorismate hydrolase